MKKIYTLLLSIFMAGVMTTAAQAQMVGIKGGLNLADFVNADYDTDSRVTGTVGISLDFAPTYSSVGFETGAYYTRRGTEVGPGQLDLDYIEVPLLAKLYMAQESPLRPHLMAGPYAAFNLDATTDIDVAGADLDIQDEVRDIDFGLMFGVGTDFNLQGMGMSLQARYAMGLTSVFDEAIDDIEDFQETFEDSERHGVWSLVLGFKF